MICNCQNKPYSHPVNQIFTQYIKTSSCSCLTSYTCNTWNFYLIFKYIHDTYALVTTTAYAEWRKTAQLMLQKTNLYNKEEKKNYVNIGLLKHGFQVMAAWRLKKMLEMFTLIFNAGCCTPEQWFEVIYLLLSNTSDLLMQHRMLHVSVILNYIQA